MVTASPSRLCVEVPGGPAPQVASVGAPTAHLVVDLDVVLGDTWFLPGANGSSPWAQGGQCTPAGGKALDCASHNTSAAPPLRKKRRKPTSSAQVEERVRAFLSSGAWNDLEHAEDTQYVDTLANCAGS
uniref:Uncharacterized protein n=1 Tax=Rhizochromulina marina TaxID=1034831 RepID=A0A7S2RQ29_9STRA|mmetsp:Transcript_19437/g.56661  ORF Transcript_19437/g.56661 Transcript_19437/m.56661 type:complete len:129 (+) Transcript_19437:230-616(+)